MTTYGSGHGTYGHSHGPVYHGQFHHGHGYGHTHSPHLAGSDEEDATRDIVHSYEHRIAFLEAEILSLSRMNNNEDVLMEENTALKAQVAQLQCENQSLRDQVNSNVEDAQVIEDLRAKVADLVAENVRLQADLDNCRAVDVDALREQIKDLTNINGNLRTTIAELEEQNARIPELEAKIQEQEDLSLIHI